MLKQMGIVAAAGAAALTLLGGVASASESPRGIDQDRDQVGLLNLNNLDVLHNVNGTLGLCGNDVNVLGVQVPIRNALNGLDVPILSPGENTAAGLSPYNCAAGGVQDGGSLQHN